VISIKISDMKMWFSDSLTSKKGLKKVLAGILLFGLIIGLLSYFLEIYGEDFIFALGISCIIGVLIGGFAAYDSGWPLGHWIGFFGGMVIAPLASLFIKSAVAAYYAAFLGPAIGLLVGLIVEYDDRKELLTAIDKIGSKELR